MKKETANNGKGHSEDHFGEYRNFWWNNDFLNLIAQRIDLKKCNKILDAGSGQCHWSKLLVRHLGKPAEIFALDKDEKWSSPDPEIEAFFHENGAGFHACQGNVQKLPFEDNSFDLVTCQTLLIHVNNPRLAITEMKRVLKPGGVLLCVEPNNMIQNLIKSSISAGNSIDEILDHVKYALICEHGKKRLGKGDNSLGDLLPGIFAEEGFEDIDVFLSDKAIPMYPPYTNAEQRATMKRWSQPNSQNPESGSDYEYFEAFGQTHLDFYEEYHKRYSALGDEFFRSIDDHAYHSAGGALMYLVTGRKGITAKKFT